MVTLALGIAAATAGCLVSQNVTFEGPRNSPPSIRSSPNALHPLNRVILLPLSGETGGDAGGLGPIRLDVDVYDPDINQELVFKVYVDYNPDAPIRVAAQQVGLVPAAPENTTGDRAKRTLNLSVTRSIFSRGCHRIELFVTSRFQPEGPDPIDSGDLAVATWWVAAQSTSSDVIDMAACP